jgi:hypothetical protein
VFVREGNLKKSEEHDHPICRRWEFGDDCKIWHTFQGQSCQIARLWVGFKVFDKPDNNFYTAKDFISQMVGVFFKNLKFRLGVFISLFGMKVVTSNLETQGQKSSLASLSRAKTRFFRSAVPYGKKRARKYRLNA